MTVLPSYLMFQQDSQPLRERLSTEFAMRPGVVVQKYAPDSDDSYSKKYWEYDVQVVMQDGAGEQPTTRIYSHCPIVSMYGGVADYDYWAPRIEEPKKTDAGATEESGVKYDPDSPNLGSNVLVMCINAEASKGYIVGALHHEKSGDPPKELGDGPYREVQYNGVNLKINKDGELFVHRKGPTKIDGEPVNNDGDKVKQPQLSIDKNGLVTVKTGDGKQVIKLDLDNGKLEILADKGVTVEVSQGKLETKASQGVKLGGDEKLVLGDKYTDAEDAFLTDLQGKLTQLVRLVTSLAATTAAITTVTPGAPAAALAAPLGTLAAQLPATFTQFKLKLKTQCLSKKNTTE